MTRAEYDEQITTWEELIDFCSDNGLDTCDDIYYYEQIDDLIYETLRADGIKYVYYLLRDIDDFDEEYFLYSNGELVNLNDEDFEEYKSDAADEFGDFDEEEYEEEYDYEEDIEDVEEDIFLKIIS